MIYNNFNTSLANLLSDVHSGRLGLPDLQRPFVWQNNKIKNLYDSLIKGFPIGYIMIWQAPSTYTKTKQIGTDSKDQPIVRDIVIDGQQRLTALYATVYGKEIVNKDYKKTKIKISYNPFTKEFDNWSASTEKNKNLIPDVSEVFEAQRENRLRKFQNDFIDTLNEARSKKDEPNVSEAEADDIDAGIRDLLNILNYQITTVNINNTTNEEDVAEIFVRVNSGGQPLTQDDFISTLLSVYDSEVRERIETFCVLSRLPQSNTSYNELIEVDMGHVIRVTAALAFKRARLGYVYKLLRGTNLESRQQSQELLEENLHKFRMALNEVLNLNNWHAFLNIAKSAGFVSSKLISASSTIVYSYALYLIAKTEFKLSADELKTVFKAWFFAASITSFYVEKTTETVAEQQLTNIKDMKTKDEFIAFMNKSIKDRMTDDFFEVRLKNGFEESNASGPLWNGFVASQIVLGYKTLFSTSSIESMFSVGASGTKNNFDYHHLFPKHFLEQQGYSSKDYNKRANFVILDYQTNIDISDKNPKEYIKEYKDKLNSETFATTMQQNGIPEDVIELTYEQFIEKRTANIIKIVHLAYDTIKPD